MATQQCIAKGFYQYTQPSNFVSVKNYIYVRENGKKCLLLRFSNDLGYIVDSMRFTVHQMDAAGNLLEKTEVEYGKMNLNPGANFVSHNAIVVDEFCTDFRVLITEVCSGKFKYTANNGYVSVDYVREKSDPQFGRSQIGIVTRNSVETARFGRPVLFKIFAGFAVLAMFAYVVVNLIQALGII